MARRPSQGAFVFSSAGRFVRTHDVNILNTPPVPAAFSRAVAAGIVAIRLVDLFNTACISRVST
jgi:hypothetical protein